MNFPFLASTIILCLLLNSLFRKNSRKAEKQEENFWDRERRANLVRRQPLDQLYYRPSGVLSHRASRGGRGGCRLYPYHPAPLSGKNRQFHRLYQYGFKTGIRCAQYQSSDTVRPELYLTCTHPAKVGGAPAQCRL